MTDKFLYLLITLLIHAFVANGQQAYYTKDTLKTFGGKIIDHGDILNAQQCTIELKGKQTIYTPYEIDEYGLKDGSVYLSKVIKIDDEERRAFLNRLNHGQINLYYYRDKKSKKFFIEKDNVQLTEIYRKGTDRSTFRDHLSEFVMDCDNVSDALIFLRFNRAVLSKFIEQYNDCERKPFPFSKYGFIFGYSYSTIRYPRGHENRFSEDFLSKDHSYNLGAFLDIPIMMSNFSLHPEFIYQKNGFKYSNQNDNTIIDILLNLTSINVPLLIRYTYPTMKLRPYMNAGATYSYIIRNQTGIYQTTILNDVIEIIGINEKLCSKNQFGFTIGSGMQYNLDIRKSVYFELRYNRINMGSNENYVNNSFQILSGISF